MKTKNNVQKTILKSVAILTSLVLFSFTVSAQSSWKQLLADNSFGAIAKVLVESSSKTSTSTEVSDLFVESNEPALELESWMIDNSLFSSFSSNSDEAYEAPLEIEEWMIDDPIFTKTYDLQEKPLQIENWMIAETFWEN
jgi:hypothetical protein